MNICVLVIIAGDYTGEDLLLLYLDVSSGEDLLRVNRFPQKPFPGLFFFLVPVTKPLHCFILCMHTSSSSECSKA